MPASPVPSATVSLMGPPYRELVSVEQPGGVQPRGGGWVMVWNLGAEEQADLGELATSRRAGVALVLVLPSEDGLSITRVLRAIERSRPQAVLPCHRSPRPGDVAAVIRRPPSSLSTSVGEYMEWRGFSLDPVTKSVVRRTIELSAHVQTISALAKNLYVSRRALGRRFVNNGLPVPSHWLHAARILRAAIKLQNSDASLFNIACSLGYSDGFSLSNQMSRLCGVRPMDARTMIGWEWLFESWLAREAERGNISRNVIEKRPSIAPLPLGPPAQHEEDLAPAAAVSL